MRLDANDAVPFHRLPDGSASIFGVHEQAGGEPVVVTKMLEWVGGDIHVTRPSPEPLLWEGDQA